MLRGCVTNLRLALLDGEQSRRAISEILHVEKQIVFFGYGRQCRSQRTNGTDLSTIA